MATTVEHLFEESLALTDASRIILAERIIESVPLDAQLFELQLDTAIRRGEELDSGQVTGIPGPDAFAQVRQALAGRAKA